MWHVEGFGSRGTPGEMETLLRDQLLPYFRERGFHVRAFSTQASLGPRQFWLATEIAEFGDIDGWAERAGEEGAAIVSELVALAVNIEAAVVAELEEH